MSTVPLIGRELCFWCIETFHGCHIHAENDSNVFWSDTSIRSLHDDQFQMTDEKALINVQNHVQYANGEFFLPPTSSVTHVSKTFHFAKCHVTESLSFSEEEALLDAPEEPVKQKRIYRKRATKKIDEKPAIREPLKKPHYTKIHKNAIKTIVNPYLRGKKCDQSQKMFVCDICEMSFTLRHNLQAHLILFHGDTANVSEEKKSLLKKTSSQIDKRAKKEKEN